MGAPLRSAYRGLLRLASAVPAEGPEGRENLAQVRAARRERFMRKRAERPPR